MARTTKKREGRSAAAVVNPAAAEPVTVSWSLAELPSPQHRAGLAGLAIMVQYTRRFSLPEEAVLDLVRLDEVGIELRLNFNGLKALMDRTYEADREEIETPRPWTKKQKNGTKVEVPPKRRETKTTIDKKGKPKEVEVCIYDVVVPRGGPLGEWAPADDGGRWIKLWRDWLWTTLRAIPKQRTPYNQRAGAGVVVDDDDSESDDDIKDVSVAWRCLVGNGSAKLASTYFLGAMDVNAENVPFHDRGRFLFLLHFWPFSIHLFVPQRLSAKGERQDDGYVACIPDVGRLRDFVGRHETALKGRSSEALRFRPKQSIVDLADAAALETDSWIETAVSGGVSAIVSRVTAGFQLVHATKDGNSVRLRSNRMITPTREQVDRSRVVSDCWSHVVKHQVLLNVLGQRVWWNGFDRVCAVYGKDVTIKDVGVALTMTSMFGADQRFVGRATTLASRVISTLYVAASIAHA